MTRSYDLAIVGAGIVGLGMALAAVRQGLSVAVVDRGAAATGASIRNFGFVTVTGQKAGPHWARARRSRDVWAEIAPLAGIPVLHHGLVMPAYREEAAEVLHAFLRTDMGEGCRMIGVSEAATLVPALRLDKARAVLHSPHELRVESREAVPRLADWLAEAHGVTFHWRTAVQAVVPEGLATSAGLVRAARVVVCPGDDLATLYPERIRSAGIRICTLQMLRVAPAHPVRLGAAVMSDLSFARYEGFADLPEAASLGRRLDRDAAEQRAAGIHLIAVQSADGSLVVGDSHVYGDHPAPFASERFDALILSELDAVLDLPNRHVAERWIGTYASATDRTVLVEAPEPNVRLAIVTGGTGASTAFALGEEVVGELFGLGADLFQHKEIAR
ncbi:FAD-dependent oxidoreductase [Aureimonas ureilytica]|uniref:FAD-dependent oxidoreductase n=1 Tax=Aureimonas ureilytica TaxID=401562 RepID=A0A175RJT7_9HYPH|nr:TIGR03364 family FAD-dependent oxidoreductase [Aureimonas ureilytica]KTR03194.1 FAD-dependent oxidoreductase [Aureimonas ureilytica]